MTRTKRRVEVRLPEHLFERVCDTRDQLGLGSTAEAMRCLIERGCKTFAGDQSIKDELLLTLIEGQSQLEYLYEFSLRQRGAEGVAALEQARAKAQHETRKVRARLRSCCSS